MKKLTCWAIVFLALFSGGGTHLFATEIVGVEYFIDTDPGFGNGASIPVEAGATVTVAETIDLNGLNEGLHTLCFRAIDDSSRWSIPIYRSFMMLRYEGNDYPDLVYLEYYIDDDPGAGNGTSVPVTAGTEISTATLIPLEALENGIHTVYFRAMDEHGYWCIPSASTFFKLTYVDDALPDVVYAEYYIDTDPGAGNGTSVPVAAGTEISTATLIPLAALENGIHTVYFRARDEHGFWCMPHASTFFKQTYMNDALPDVVYAEYYIDTDPGFGNGTSFTLPPGENPDIAETIALTGFECGIHMLVVRAQDDLGRWSVIATRPFLVENAAADLITAVSYEYHQEGDVTETIVYDSFTPDDEVTLDFEADLSGLENGEEYTLSIHGVNSNGVNSLPSFHTFTITELNYPPTVSHPIPDLSLDEDFEGFFIADLDTVFDDLNLYTDYGDSLIFGLSVTGDDALISIMQDTLLAISPVADAFGELIAVVTATDDSGATTSDTFLVTVTPVNDAPTDFLLVSPPDDTELHMDTVTVSWTRSSDVEDATLQYRVEWGLDATFTASSSATTSDTFFVLTDIAALLAGEGDYSEDETENLSGYTAVVSGNLAKPQLFGKAASGERDQGDLIGNDELDELPDDSRIYWRVIAFDSDDAGVYANDDPSGWSFTIDVFDTPGAFSLLSPVDWDTCWTLDTVLTWEASVDDDPYDTPFYDVWFGIWGQDMALIADSISETSFAVEDLDDDQNYCWTVRATDSNTGGIWADDTLALVTYFPEPPGEFGLILPVDQDTSFTGEVEFSWEDAVDPDPGDILVYNLVVSHHENFQFAGVLDTGAETSGVWDFSDEDNMTNYWTVFVYDQYENFVWASDTFSVLIYLPDPPDAFGRLSPEDGAVVHQDTVTVTWQHADDPDPNDQVTYIVDWSLDASFAIENTYSATTAETTYTINGLEAMLAGLAQHPDAGVPGEYVPLAMSSGRETERARASGKSLSGFSTGRQSVFAEDGVAGLDELPDDSTIYWRVRAVDSFDSATWADNTDTGWSFQVYLAEPPEPFSLLEPGNESTLNQLSAVFSWESANDPDPDDIVTYSVYLSGEETFSEDDLIATGLDSTSYLFSTLVDDSTYFWTVKAVDGNSDGTWANEIWHFLTNLPEAPLQFNLVAPLDSLEITSVADFPLQFEWEATSDPDPGDVVHYLLEITDVADTAFVNPAEYAADTLTTAQIDSLDIAEYLWRVVATDSYGLETPSDETRVLIVTMRVDELPFSSLPEKYSIAATYPNPFNPALTVVVGLPQTDNLDLRIYNLLGREVARLADEELRAGYHMFVFNASELASGVYFIRAHVPGKLNEVRKIQLLK